MPNDFSDFNVDDIYYGIDADDAPAKAKADAAEGDKPAARAASPTAAKGDKPQTSTGLSTDSGDKPPGKASGKTSGKTSGKSGKAAKARTLVQLVVILLILALDAAQLMGIAYRDTLDRGWPTSSAHKVFANLADVAPALPVKDAATQAPDLAVAADKVERGDTLSSAAASTSTSASTSASTPTGGGAPQSASAATRSADAVAVAPKALAQPSRPQPKKTDDAAKPAEAEPPKAVVSTKSAAKPAAKPATKPTPTPAPATTESVAATGTHAVAVGIFRSQRHVVQLKRDIEKLSLPHFTKVTEKKGEGFVLRTKSADADAFKAAKAALGDKGYDYKESGKALVAYFHYEDEAAGALALVGAAGVSGAVEKISGPLPVWKLLVGPMSSTRAKVAARKLSAAKIDNYLLRLKK